MLHCNKDIYYVIKRGYYVYCLEILPLGRQTVEVKRWDSNAYYPLVK